MSQTARYPDQGGVEPSNYKFGQKTRDLLKQRKDEEGFWLDSYESLCLRANSDLQYAEPNQESDFDLNAEVSC